jgi:acyl-CoA dehydrogenase
MIFNKDRSIQRYGNKLGEYSVLFRSIADEVDKNPDAIFYYINHEAIVALSSLRTLSAEDFFCLYEALAYGDVGVLFAAPRTCLSGILLQLIGTSAQQESYFTVVKQQKLRSFFATTEPQYGSDASRLATQFDMQHSATHFAISGEKILVGNLGLANIGVIIGRASKGLLGINAALVLPEDISSNKNSIERETLPMFGIRAALLGKALFNKFLLPKERLLGQHLNPFVRGLTALVKTFNIMRLGITGLALGHAQAVIDYIESTRKHFTVSEQQQLGNWQSEVDGIRKVALSACEQNAQNRSDTALISLVKVRASKLVETIASTAINYFGARCLLEHPFLIKSLRDCFGYEYMDGTSNIQRKNIYQGYEHGLLKVN